MNVDIFKSRLQPLSPLYLPGGSEGTVRILEKSARVVCDVVSGELADEEQIAAEIDSLLSTSWSSEQQPPVRLSIHLLHDAVAVEGIGPALAALADFLGPSARTLISIHLDSARADWSAIHSRVKFLRETASRPKEVSIQLIAPFTEFREDEMETLFHLGVRIRFAAGWTMGCPSDSSLEVDTDALRRFSEFGFRSTIEWYVHAGNIAQAEQQIPDLLLANYYSGFSLPLVSDNPYYRFGPGFPPLPNALQYCQLLVRSYKAHPYYDDVFSPLTTLLLLIRESGWQTQLSIPTITQVVVDAEGHVGLYRRSAALAIPWITVAELAAAPLERTRERFLQVVGDAWRWDRNPYCRDCRWRYICGGLDPSAHSHLSTGELDVLCGHRKLFMEHFASVRAPDRVIGAPQRP